MKIVIREISDLNQAEYNPRKMSSREDKDLEESLRKFGFVDPAIINKHPDRMDVVIGGHQRLRKWKQMGHNDAPTVEQKLVLEDEKELNIRLNKNNGQFDEELLIEHFEESELLEWGFTGKEVEFMDPQEKDERVAPKINVTHTCPKCGFAFSDKADKE